MKRVLLILVCFLAFSVPVMAAESEEVIEIPQESLEELETEDSGVEDVPEVNYVAEFPDAIGTYQLNEDDYNYSEFGTYAVNGDVYAGSYNSTIISLWNGLLNNNVGKDYIGFRSSQYEYYIFFGEDFTVNGDRFSGSGSYYYLNTYGNAYGYTFGTDSFSIDASSGYLYTNVSPDYPSLDNDRGLIYEHIQTVMLIALLAFYVLRWIFIRK